METEVYRVNSYKLRATTQTNQFLIFEVWTLGKTSRQSTNE